MDSGKAETLDILKATVEEQPVAKAASMNIIVVIALILLAIAALLIAVYFIYDRWFAQKTDVVPISQQESTKKNSEPEEEFLEDDESSENIEQDLLKKSMNAVDSISKRQTIEPSGNQEKTNVLDPEVQNISESQKSAATKSVIERTQKALQQQEEIKKKTSSTDGKVLSYVPPEKQQQETTPTDNGYKEADNIINLTTAAAAAANVRPPEQNSGPIDPADLLPK